MHVERDPFGRLDNANLNNAVSDLMTDVITVFTSMHLEKCSLVHINHVQSHNAVPTFMIHVITVFRSMRLERGTFVSLNCTEVGIVSANSPWKTFLGFLLRKTNIK